jgi:glucosyl-3-phosphoglycerate phosphatase
MSRLILVRHGETEWNNERRLQGQADLPLSRAGREQVVALRALVQQLRPDIVVASDLQRTRETAALLGFPDAQLDRRLREADLGAWSGRYIADLRETALADYRAWREGHFTPPEAEPWNALYDRVGEVVDAAAASGAATLLVTHGGPIRAACLRLINLHPQFVMPVAPASVTVIELRQRPRLAGFNLLPDYVAVDAPE